MPIESYYSFALFWVLIVQLILDLQPVTKGHRLFLAIMVDIIGGFKARFNGIASKNFPDCPTTGFSRLDPPNGIAESCRDLTLQAGATVRGKNKTPTSFFG
jgi:hypothetical protein